MKWWKSIIGKNPKAPEHKEVPLEAQGLTDREKEILQLLIEGKTAKDMASPLEVSQDIIETHIRNLYNMIHFGPAPGTLKSINDKL